MKDGGVAWRVGSADTEQCLLPKDPVWIDARPLPSSAWADRICIDTEVEVEAAKSVPYRRLMLRAVQLLSEVYASCGGRRL
jgi:hypothetical protein